MISVLLIKLSRVISSVRMGNNDTIGGSCTTHKKMKINIPTFLVGKFEGNVPRGKCKRRGDSNLILKQILKELSVKMQIRCSWVRIGFSGVIL